METCEAGNLPARIEAVLVEGLGVVTVVRRMDPGCLVVCDCMGRGWLLAADFPVQFFDVGGAYVPLELYE